MAYLDFTHRPGTFALRGTITARFDKRHTTYLQIRSDEGRKYRCDALWYRILGDPQDGDRVRARLAPHPDMPGMFEVLRLRKANP